MESIADPPQSARQHRQRDREERAALAELTPREQDVLKGIAQGLSDREIAERLDIRPATARTHTARVLAKLGVHSRVQAALIAVRHGVSSR